jgi:hypothetical protein
MKTIICIIVYWIASIVATFFISKANYPKAKLPHEGESIGFAIIVWILIGLVSPFIVPVFVFGFVYNWYSDKRYKNKPRPVPSNLKKRLHKDTVLDENKKTVSLAEYNYSHGTNFTLDEVYGKGYEDSLSEDEKSSIKDSYSKFGVLKIEENLFDSFHTKVATILGKAMLSGEFDEFNSYMEDNVETILYGSNKTIKGKSAVSNYWMNWRDKYVVTKEVNQFQVKHAHYYSNSCLQLGNMVVLFMINEEKITKLVLSTKNIAGRTYAYHDNLIEDYPFSLSYIKRYLKPLREANECRESVVKENRLPCFGCGMNSQDLDWYSAYINVGFHGYPCIVSICPKCQKVVEFYTEGRARHETLIWDEYDILEKYIDCWNNLQVGDLGDYLDDDFHYSSHWVFEELDKDNYLSYLSGKFDSISKTGKKVKARLEDKLIVLTQDGKNLVISIEFKDNLIVRADMSPASLYGLPDEIQQVEKFTLKGVINFYNDTPLKGTKYVDKIPSDLVVERKNSFRLNDTLSLQRIATQSHKSRNLE